MPANRCLRANDCSFNFIVLTHLLEVYRATGFVYDLIREGRLPRTAVTSVVIGGSLFSLIIAAQIQMYSRRLTGAPSKEFDAPPIGSVRDCSIARQRCWTDFGSIIRDVVRALVSKLKIVGENIEPVPAALSVGSK